MPRGTVPPFAQLASLPEGPAAPARGASLSWIRYFLRTMLPARFLYLHGFASSPQSQKAQEFQKRLAAAGVPLMVPALDEGDFKNITITRMLAVVDRLLDAGPGPVVVIGSSLGGYLAALAAARRPFDEARGRGVAQLFLMAPAFDFARRMALRLGDGGVRRWRESGELLVRHYATGRDESLGPAMIEDAAAYPAFPDARCPTVIVHGQRDTEVPPEVSTQFAKTRPNVEVILVDDEHSLTARFETIWERFLKLPFLPGRA